MENIQEQLFELKELLLKAERKEKQFYSLEQACDYLQLSKPSLYKLTSKKEITYYIPGGKKIYFQKEDLDNWVLSGRVVICTESIQDVERFLTKNS